MYLCSRRLAGLDGRFDDGARAWFGLVGFGKIGYPDPQEDETQGGREKYGAAEGPVRHLYSESAHWGGNLH